MLDKAIEIIRETLRLGDVELTEDTNLKEDLGADSLDLFEVAMAFEEEFDVEIPTEELEIETGVRKQLEYTVEPANATVKNLIFTVEPANAGVKVSSSGVVEVENGSFVVQAKSSGSTMFQRGTGYVSLIQDLTETAGGSVRTDGETVKCDELVLNHSHSVTETTVAPNIADNGTAKGNMQPYITCYMWKRIQ